MIDFEKIVSKYNTEAENKIDMAQKVLSLYSELCEAISEELSKTSYRNFLIPAISAALEANAIGIISPFKNDELICGLKDILIDATRL